MQIIFCIFLEEHLKFPEQINLLALPIYQGPLPSMNLYKLIKTWSSFAFINVPHAMIE